MIERHLRNPKSSVIEYEKIDTLPYGIESYKDRFDYKTSEFCDDFSIEDSTLMPYIKMGTVPPISVISNSNTLFKPKYITIDGEHYVLTPKKPKLEINATIRNGATVFSATWLSGVNQTNNVVDENIYKITTNGSYKGKFYQWKGTSYIQVNNFGYGEIAINFSSQAETIFFRNSQDEIISINKNTQSNLTDFVGSHTFNGKNIVGRGGLVPMPSKPNMFLSSNGGWETIENGGGSSTTDTKNTAGSINTSDKIYIVGTKTKATTADNDNNQTYTNGNNYVGSDGWLYTGENQKVLVDADLDAIRQALASMEEWPTVTTSANVVPSITTKVVTESVPTAITTYYKLDSTNLGTNSSVQVAGGALTMAKAVSIATTTTFTPASDTGYQIKNEISGMDFGYKTSLSDTTKSSDTTRTETVTVTPTHTRTNNSSTATFVVKKQVNGGSWTDAATGTLSSGTITIANAASLGNLAEGTTKLKLVYTNTSTIARATKSYTVPAVGNTYYSSNINNFDSTHVSSIAQQTGTLPAVTTKYAESSSSGVKSGGEFIIYGVYPLYTNGSRNQSSAITGDNRTNGTTGGATTYNRFGSSDVAGPNYAANATSTWYVSFGEINISNASLNKAYIYTPAVTGGRSVTITSVQGANSSTGSYDSGTVNMTIANDGTVTISGRTCTRWWIKNPAGSEGANSYKITITAANE